MAKVSKAQRTAILEAHAMRAENGGRATRRTAAPTLQVLQRNGWMNEDAGVTRAGLIAAGVDMDAIRAYASVENAGRTIHTGTFRESCAQHGCPGCPPLPTTERVEVGADGCDCPVTAVINVYGTSIDGTERVEHRPGCWNAGPLADVAEVRALVSRTDAPDGPAYAARNRAMAALDRIERALRVACA